MCDNIQWITYSYIYPHLIGGDTYEVALYLQNKVLFSPHAISPQQTVNCLPTINIPDQAAPSLAEPVAKEGAMVWSLNTTKEPVCGQGPQVQLFSHK